MLDTLNTILEFLQGTCYSVYTLASAIKSGIDFIIVAVPHANNFINSVFEFQPLFSAPCLACLALGVLRFFWVGGD